MNTASAVGIVMGRQASPLFVAVTGPPEEVAGAGGGETLVVVGVVGVCVGVLAGVEGVAAGVEGVAAAITGVGAAVATPVAVALEEPQPLSTVTKHAI